MNEAGLLDVARESVIVLFKISAPALLTGLVIGLIVSIFQTLTQINEQTMTFIPKFIATLVVMVISASFMLESLGDFMRSIMSRVVSGE